MDPVLDRVGPNVHVYTFSAVCAASLFVNSHCFYLEMAQASIVNAKWSSVYHKGSLVFGVWVYRDIAR